MSEGQRGQLPLARRPDGVLDHCLGLEPHLNAADQCQPVFRTDREPDAAGTEADAPADFAAGAVTQQYVERDRRLSVFEDIRIARVEADVEAALAGAAFAVGLFHPLDGER